MCDKFKHNKITYVSFQIILKKKYIVIIWVWVYKHIGVNGLYDEVPVSHLYIETYVGICRSKCDIKHKYMCVIFVVLISVLV